MSLWTSNAMMIEDFFLLEAIRIQNRYLPYVANIYCKMVIIPIYLFKYLPSW